VQHVQTALLVISLAGCGFRPLGNNDLGNNPPLDLSMPGSGGTGPGPEGALPAGYCCDGPQQCRSRQCMSGYCLDECSDNSECTAFGAAMTCDLSSGTCMPGAGFSCLDPSGYHYGSKTQGACCQSGFPQSGQECASGRCIAFGPDTNPFICTSACIQGVEPCPIGFQCTVERFCAPNDPNASYTCQ